MKSLRDQIREAAERDDHSLRMHELIDALADVVEAADAMAMWLSAAMEDENVCSEMKRDCEAQLEALHLLQKELLK